MTQPTYLFVYGTLRSKVEIPVKQEIGQRWQVIGETEIKGSLYDMGDYPAAVQGSGTIKGEVYLIKEPEAVFGILDKYEGEAYKRQLENIVLPDGNNVQAWVYWYIKPVDGKILIGDKDYLAYREKKGRVY